MLNILIPLAGKSEFFQNSEYKYPDILNEILGKTMIELALRNYKKIEEEKRFIFVLDKKECEKYHIDNILKILTNNNCKIVKLPGKTKGAVCSCLMAIDYINTEDELIIANGNQVIDENLKKVLSDFRNRKLDSGVICFNSVHPKWSYARVEENGEVIETTEKNPISKNAIAGFYYFRKGSYFIRAGMKLIEKDANYEGNYYIAPTINELILENKRISIYEIEEKDYHSFYSPKKIKEYENCIKQ